MYANQYLAKERQREYLQQAEKLQVTHQLAHVRRLKKRQERAERKLMAAWDRVEELRELLSLN